MQTDVNDFESLEPRLMLSADLMPLSAGGGNDAPTACMAALTAGPAMTASASLPLSPTVSDTITAPGVVRKIYVFGSLAFAVGDAGVQIASIANPGTPSVLSSISTAPASVTSITVANSMLYVGLSSGVLAIYDISTPSTPVFQGQMTVPSASGGTVTIQGMAYLEGDNVSGTDVLAKKCLYLACLDKGVIIIDVTAPASPSVLYDGGGDGTSARDVAIVGSGQGGWANNALAYIMGNYVYLVNASNPDSPTTGSRLKYSSPYELFTDGTKLYVTDSAGLHMVDATSFTHPIKRGTVAPSPAAQSSDFDIAAPAGGQLAYFSQVGAGVTIVDTGASGGPEAIGTYNDANALGIAAYGSTLYVADYDGANWYAVDTGVSRDLTVSNSDAGNYYIAPGKTFKINASVNNLGNLAVMANQKISVTAYLSVDGTFNSAYYQLSPLTYVNSGIAALADMAKTLSVKAPAGVPEGYYYLILKLSDGGAADGDLTDNLWVSPDASVQVLKGNPVISMTMDSADDSGVPGDNITNISPVSFTGTTRADCAVVLNRGGKVLATTRSADDGSFSFAGIALVSGANSLSVTATDRAGNTGTLTQKVVLDTAVSASTLNLDRGSDSGKVGDFLTNINSVKLTGKTEKGADVVLWVNGQRIASAVASSRGEFAFTSVTLSTDNGGANDVTVQITDVAGNTTSVSKTVTLDTIADTPTLALAPASDTGTPGDNITSLARVTLTGTAEPGSKVYLKVLKNTKYATVASTTAADDGTFTFARVSLKLGENTFGAFATDLAGNLASTTGLVVTYRTA